LSTQDYIIKNPSWQASQDYALLRKEGLQHIEKLAHQLWTDYNVHDPGVTQLELLCYAITDLGYRTGYEIKDLLTVEKDGVPAIRGAFHTARDIFSCNPVSFNDLRKLLIDIEGVSNAWIEKHKSVSYCADRVSESLTECSSSAAAAETLHGLYDVFIEHEEDIETTTQKQTIRQAVLERLMTHRNLCEDVVNICNLDKEDIALCADLEVTPGADMEAVLAEVFYRLDQFISPPVKFYTIQELLERGKSSDEIFAGPKLEHGFIDDDEFRQIERRCALRVSDIIQLIMDVPEVVAVKDISLLSFIDAVKRAQQKWILQLATGQFRSPRFSAALSRVTFYKNGLPYFANPVVVESLLKEKLAAQIETRLKEHDNDLAVPVGEDRALQDYYPVQNELPKTYHAGTVTTPASATNLRKAQSRQLKAWMLFFEQMLANYLSQLANIHELFSWQSGSGKTYFTQQVTGIADIEALYINYADLPNSLQQIIESDSAAEERKNRFLDHLLARFCESFTDYGLLMYNLDGDFTQQRLIADKRAFLQDYPRLSQQRGQGFDYRHPEDTDNLSGYQRRVYRLLGIDEPLRHNLSWHGFAIVRADETAWRFVLKDADNQLLFNSIPCDTRDRIEALLDLALGLGGCSVNYRKSADAHYELLRRCSEKSEPEVLGATVSLESLETVLGLFMAYTNAEGFHVIEHALLRRRSLGSAFMPPQFNSEDECRSVEVSDPYSFRFSIFLPAWPRRFRDLRFRQFVEDTLRLEAPAHTQPRICWLSHTQMQALETAYNRWALLLAQQQRLVANCAESEDTLPDSSGQYPLPDEETFGAYDEALTALIDVMHAMTTVYPLARLHDCEHIDTSTPPVTLNNTILGTF